MMASIQLEQAVFTGRLRQCDFLEAILRPDFISLVDKDRQWFKSRVHFGFGRPESTSGPFLTPGLINAFKLDLLPEQGFVTTSTGNER